MEEAEKIQKIKILDLEKKLWVVIGFHKDYTIAELKQGLIKVLNSLSQEELRQEASVNPGGTIGLEQEKSRKKAPGISKKR